jgi:hypothetical protein
MKNKKTLLLCIMLGLLMVALSGCAPGDGSNSGTKLAGFFSGVWHGWIAPFTLIWSLFNQNIGIYEVFNSGFWYDLGYYMAIISGFGGLALFRKSKKSTRGSSEN